MRRRLLKAAERIIVLTTAAVVSGRLWENSFYGLSFAIIVVGALGIIAEEDDLRSKNHEEQTRIKYRPKASTGITISQMALILPTCLIVLNHRGQTKSAAYMLAQALILTTILNRFLFWAPSWRVYVLATSLTFCSIGSTILPALLHFLSGSKKSKIGASCSDGLRRLLWMSSVIGSQTSILYMFAISGFSRSFSRGELELTSVFLSLPMANSVMRALMRLFLLIQSTQQEIGERGGSNDDESCRLIICSSSSVSGNFALVSEAAIVGMLLSMVLSARFLNESRNMILKKGNVSPIAYVSSKQEEKYCTHEHKKKSFLATGIITSSFLSTGYFLALSYINKDPIIWLLKVLQPPNRIITMLSELLSFSLGSQRENNQINGIPANEAVTALYSAELGIERKPSSSRMAPFFIIIYWLTVLIPGIIFSPTPTIHSRKNMPKKHFSELGILYSAENKKKTSKQNSEVTEHELLSKKNLKTAPSSTFTLLFSYKWDDQGISTLTARKWYHFLAAVAFTPCIALNPAFTAFAFVGALLLFIMAEALRIGWIYPFHSLFSSLFERYLDSRDKGPLIMSHTYLLLGCALPVFLYLLMDDLRSYGWSAGLSGIISLGIGDSFASIVGVNYGCRFLPPIPGTHKSFEGMIAGYGSMILSIAVVSVIASDEFSIEIAVNASRQHVIPAALCALLEVCTDQMDNLFLPTFYFVWLVISLS